MAIDEGATALARRTCRHADLAPTDGEALLQRRVLLDEAESDVEGEEENHPPIFYFALSVAGPGSLGEVRAAGFRLGNETTAGTSALLRTRVQNEYLAGLS